MRYGWHCRGPMVGGPMVGVGHGRGCRGRGYGRGLG